MRKIKTLLMIVFLGMLFISCSDTVNTNLKFNAEEIIAVNSAANDSTNIHECLIVETENYTTISEKMKDGTVVPVLRVTKESPAEWVIFALALLIGFGIGAAVFTD